VIRTVLGDVAAPGLGVTYLHEHLIIDHPLVADRFPHISLPSVEEAVGEVRRCAAAGVGAMVDAMPCAAGRNIVKLVEVSRRTGVAVVATTGLHTARYYAAAPWAREARPDVLADLFVADIEQGVDRFDYTGPVVERTSHRAGVVKVATMGDRPDQAERRAFEAAAQAHLRTGAPVMTHCEDGRGGEAQVELLTELGVAPSRIVLSHTDKVEDPTYHRDLLGAGVNLEYDQLLRRPQPTLGLLDAMLSEGHLPRLMLGTDGARRSLWTELGGSPGLAALPTLITPHLDDTTRHTLLVDNPAAFLAFYDPYGA
jgi:5-phospho-D-xylono-1,4-lactonase